MSDFRRITERMARNDGYAEGFQDGTVLALFGADDARNATIFGRRIRVTVEWIDQQTEADKSLLGRILVESRARHLRQSDPERWRP